MKRGYCCCRCGRLFPLPDGVELEDYDCICPICRNEITKNELDIDDNEDYNDLGRDEDYGSKYDDGIEDYDDEMDLDLDDVEFDESDWISLESDDDDYDE